MIGLDTSAIIDLFKGNPAIQKVLEKNQEPVAATIISYLELSWGIDPDKKKHLEEEEYYDDFFRSVHEINLTKNACKKASTLNRELKKRGKTIDQLDCLIASMFLENGIKKVITGNKRHFNMINGIKVISY